MIQWISIFQSGYSKLWYVTVDHIPEQVFKTLEGAKQYVKEKYGREPDRID